MIPERFPFHEFFSHVKRQRLSHLSRFLFAVASDFMNFLQNIIFKIQKLTRFLPRKDSFFVSVFFFFRAFLSLKTVFVHFIHLLLRKRKKSTDSTRKNGILKSAILKRSLLHASHFRNLVKKNIKIHNLNKKSKKCTYFHFFHHSSIGFISGLLRFSGKIL